MRMISVTVSVVVGLLLAASTAAAQPAPPPNPSDDALDASRAAVVERAAELGRLSGLAAELDGRAATARAVLQDRREVAFERLTALQAAEVAADAAAERAADAGVATTAARNAVDQARLRLDQAAAATYQQTLDLGPLGLLTGAQTPEELVARAEFGNLVAGGFELHENRTGRAAHRVRVRPARPSLVCLPRSPAHRPRAGAGG